MESEYINMPSVPTGLNLWDIPPWILILIIAWTFVWKGLALWRAAELRHKYWFVIVLVVNTLGILEIIYLFGIARKYKVEVVEKIE